MSILYSWAGVQYFLCIWKNFRRKLIAGFIWGRGRVYKVGFSSGIAVITLFIALFGISARINLFRTSGPSVSAVRKNDIGDSDFVDEAYSLNSIVSVSDYSSGYELEEYIVQKGDTLSSISSKFEISEDTIKWANDLASTKLTVGHKLKILPMDGVLHTVEEGEDLSSIASK